MAGYAQQDDERVYRYYRCHFKMSKYGGTCANLRPRADDLETKLCDGLEEHLTCSDWLQTQMEKHLHADTSDDVETAMTVDHIKRQLAEEEREKERVIELVRRGVLTFDETDRELAKVRSETEALQRRMEELSDRAERERQREQLAQFSVTFAQAFPHLTDAEKREMLREMDMTATVFRDGSVTARGIIPPTGAIAACSSVGYNSA